MNALLFSITACTLVCIFVACVGTPIEIITDKDVYDVGETVHILIKNKSGKTIRDSITLRITDEEGNSVYEELMMVGWSELKPGESWECEWDQKSIRQKGSIEGKYTIWAMTREYKVSKEIEIRSND